MMTTNPYEWLFKDSPSLLLILDESLRCQNIAKVWTERLEEQLRKAPSIAAAQLFDFDSQPELVTQFKAVVQKGIPIENVSIDLLMSDGIVPGRLCAWRAYANNDKHPFIMVAASDVSKYRDAIEELNQLQSQYSLILNSAGEGIYGLDADGRIAFGNAATENIVGWRADKMLGQKSHDVHHHSYPDGSHYPREKCPIYAALKDGEVHQVDNEVFWHADGSAIPVEYSSTPILKDGVPNGAVVVFRDISERKTLEQERDSAFNEIKKLKDRLELERDYLRDEVKTVQKYGEIIGQSPALKRTQTQIEAVATTTASVLILGESGTGKELIARAIHSQSNRADKPLVKVNCASIPKDLFESEFFGHVKGAFTGAHQDRIGRIQLAEGGTLFLDEVGEIPLSQQGKLLRALQEHEFERVGDGRTMKADVRIVAATNQDLETLIKAGTFREDLYYRLSVFPVKVPSLRERIEDIAPLAMHFIELNCKEFGRPLLKLSKHQVEILRQHCWPGNIRELKNVIERSVILSTGSRINLDLTLTTSSPVEKAQPQTETQSSPGDYLTDAEFRKIERENIINVLRHSNWQVWGQDGAAQRLGVKPSTLSYRMKKLDIQSDKP
ncbi:MAG: sigma-54 interaction domain-containing protein [bacterium]